MAAEGTSVARSSLSGPLELLQPLMKHFRPVGPTVVEIAPDSPRPTTHTPPVSSSSAPPAPGSTLEQLTDAERCAVEFLRGEFPARPLDLYLRMIERVLSVPDARLTPFDREVLAAYRNGAVAEQVRRTLTGVRANAVQRQRAAKADPLQTAAAWLLEQCPDLG